MAACHAQDVPGILVSLEVADEAYRPVHVELLWYPPGASAPTPARLPDPLPTAGRALGSVYFQTDGTAGERRVIARGRRADETIVSEAAVRIPFDGKGRADVALVLGAPLPDRDGDGVPDAVDDDGADGGAADDGGTREDAAASLDAPVVRTDATGAPGGSDAAPGGSDGAPRAPNAAACKAPSDCTSGFCVDGVCCAAACKEACMACNLPGALGVCAPIAAGDDPTDDCKVQDAASCGNDGVCDGQGGCRKHAEGTKCAAATCVGTDFATARTCDGKGTCRPAVKTSCGGYRCASSEGCHTKCSGNGECSPGNACTGGVCSGPKPLGVACMTAGDCASGQCHQGVCCASSCTGGCYSCALPGSAGSCVPIPAGGAPLEGCKATPPAQCGFDVACDGRGACRMHAAGTDCAPAICSAAAGGTMQLAARTCDGRGTCRAAVGVDCTPFTCAGDQCRKSCTVASDCAAGAFCSGTTCIPKRPNGGACGGAGECASNICVRGVCCGTACEGTCMACNLPGTAGTCRPVPDGQDPYDHCADLGAGACKGDGQCNGMGACRLYKAGSVCAPGICTSNTGVPDRTCDGQGTCQQVTPIPCGKFVCGATACKTTCAVNTDCVGPSVCNTAAGTCGGLRAEYFATEALTTSRLVRVDTTIDFDWKLASPDPTVPPDMFSVRWTGQLRPRFSETYTLRFGADDGVRLWLDGALLIDQWAHHSYREDTASVALSATRTYDLKIEYHEGQTDATARFFWESPSQPREIVPTSALTPAP